MADFVTPPAAIGNPTRSIAAGGNPLTYGFNALSISEDRLNRDRLERMFNDTLGAQVRQGMADAQTDRLSAGMDALVNSRDINNNAASLIIGNLPQFGLNLPQGAALDELSNSVGQSETLRLLQQGADVAKTEGEAVNEFAQAGQLPQGQLVQGEVAQLLKGFELFPELLTNGGSGSGGPKTDITSDFYIPGAGTSTVKTTGAGDVSSLLDLQQQAVLGLKERFPGSNIVGSPDNPSATLSPNQTMFARQAAEDGAREEEGTRQYGPDGSITSVWVTREGQRFRVTLDINGEILEWTQVE